MSIRHWRAVLALLMLLASATACDQFSSRPTRAAISTVLENPNSTPEAVAIPTSVQAPTPDTQTIISNPPGVSAAPLVQIVSPQTNSSLSANQTVNVVAYASDDAGIARVELFVDNISVYATSAPPTVAPVFSAILPWTPNQIGTHTLRVVATDVTNRSSSSDELTVTVLTDARKPSAIIVYPIGTPQYELGDVVQIHGISTDESGVVQLELWVDNQIYTYVTSQNASGQIQFANLFTWSALTLGQHTLFIRARDAQDQTTDSAPLRLVVVSAHLPTLNVIYERTNALAGEPITVTITALDVTGIARVELVSGKEILASVPSANPPRQTILSTQIAWQNPNPGDYPLIVRAVSASNTIKESATQVISILRPGQSTPTPLPQPTPTRTRAPRATATPRLQPPPPPVAEILQLSDGFSLPAPLRVTFSGKGNAELDRIELWGTTQGQSNAQIICSIDARATTNKTAQCDWNPPTAGAVTVFAQTVDVYRQTHRSIPIGGYIGVPILPTPTATPQSLVGRWLAPPYVLTLRPTGSSLRGELNDGRINSGTIKGDRVTFRVDYAPTTVFPPTATITATATVSATTSITATITPTSTPVIPSNVTALDFDCGVDASGTILTCTFKDARGRTGNLTFKRE